MQPSNHASANDHLELSLTAPEYVHRALAPVVAALREAHLQCDHAGATLSPLALGARRRQRVRLQEIDRTRRYVELLSSDGSIDQEQHQDDRHTLAVDDLDRRERQIALVAPLSLLGDAVARSFAADILGREDTMAIRGYACTWAEIVSPHLRGALAALPDAHIEGWQRYALAAQRRHDHTLLRDMTPGHLIGAPPL